MAFIVLVSVADNSIVHGIYDVRQMHRKEHMFTHMAKCLSSLLPSIRLDLISLLIAAIVIAFGCHQMSANDPTICE